MPRITVFILVFILGVILAFAVGYGDRLSSFVFRSDVGESVSADAEQNTEDELKEVRSLDALDYQQRKRAMLGRGVSEKERLGVLREAIDEGTLDSLQLIRPEYLRFLPHYQDQILPTLKRQVLKNIVRRFTEQDWMDWPQASYSDHEGPTSARLFVDDITVVNPDLGRYVETAAQLFHGMYLSIMRGNRYDLEEDLYYILQNAERILDPGRIAGVPARLSFDPSIIGDPIFLPVLERIRGDLLVLYAKRNPREINTQVDLLLTLDSRFCSKRVYQFVRSLIYRLAIEASVRYRENVFPKLVESPVVRAFSEEDPLIRHALAELYLIQAVDALEQGLYVQAEQLLEVSVKMKSGIKAQKAIRGFLLSLKEESEVGKQDIEPPKKAEVDDQPSFVETLGSSSIWQVDLPVKRILLYTLLLVVAILGGGRVFLYVVANRQTRKLQGLGSSDSASQSEGSMLTSPSEISFEEEFESEVVNN